MKISRRERKKAAKVQNRDNRRKRRKQQEKRSLSKQENLLCDRIELTKTTRELSEDEIEKEFKQNKGNLSDWLNEKHPDFRKEFKEEWAQLPKKIRKLYSKNDQKRIKQAYAPDIVFPFLCNPDDHCETSLEAYKDISPILSAISKANSVSPQQLKIYDPYYCAGGVKRNLEILGFGNVINKPEDFYKAIQELRIPEYNVLLTNPPYSDDHIQRLLAFTAKEPSPSLLLLPSYVEKKAFFKFSKFYILEPNKRYHYWIPKGLRQKEKLQSHACSLGFRTSPFLSSWYIDLKKIEIDVRKLYRKNKAVKLRLVAS